MKNMFQDKEYQRDVHLDNDPYALVGHSGNLL